MKNYLSGLGNYLSVGWAKRFMKRWLTWARKAGLTPMRKVEAAKRRSRGKGLSGTPLLFRPSGL